MRITRSGLRRIIAEESARILAEAHERVPGGHQMRIAAGFEDEPAEVDFEDEDEDDYSYGDDPDEFLDLPAGEIQRRLRDLDEGEGKKRHQSPRDRLAAYLDRVGADSAAIMRAVDRAVDRAHEEGSEVTSEDITFNLSDEVLDAIPEDDSDRWHSMLDAVLADEIDPDAFADAEADRRDVEDTERDLSHPSRFLEEGDDTEGDEAFGDVDPYEMGEYQHAYSMGGGSDEEGFAIDYDTGRPSRFAAKHLARPAAAVDDIDGGEDMGEVDPYEMGEYQHAHSMGGGADEEGFYMDYDRGLDEGEEGGDFDPDVGYIDDPKSARHGKPMKRRGADDEPLNEARWAKLAGILKG